VAFLPPAPSGDLWFGAFSSHRRQHMFNREVGPMRLTFGIAKPHLGRRESGKRRTWLSHSMSGSRWVESEDHCWPSFWNAREPFLLPTPIPVRL